MYNFQKRRSSSSNIEPFISPDLVIWLGSQYSTAGKNPNTITLNGSNASQWNDRNGGALFVAQPTAEAQPAYNQNQVNGWPVLTSDGTESLVGSGFPDLDKCTIFAVGEFQAGDTTQALFDYAVPGATNTGISLLHEAGQVKLRANTIDGGGDAAYIAPLPVPFSIFECVVDGSNVTLYVNGVQKAQLSTGILGNILTAFAVMGLVVSVGYENLGNAAEFLVYSDDIGATPRYQTRGYLSKEWGISI